MKKDEIILVDNFDNITGYGEKMDVHKKGKLHRAFSIFIFNAKVELLLQKREESKYHSGGLWTNTCCSHPVKGETIEEAAVRRLSEEMGFTCRLEKIFSFIYKTEFNNDLYENEYDHVFIGTYSNEPEPDPSEVMDWKWVSPDEIEEDLKINPDKYTYWFKICFKRVKEFLKNNKLN